MAVHKAVCDGFDMADNWEYIYFQKMTICLCCITGAIL